MGKIENEPLVSIVTPVHNGEAFFAETIKTVCEQSYRNWEWIIVDDKSDDNTVAIINETLKQTGDKRIRLIKLDRNSGAAKARNAGIKAARGRFLAFLDADDLWAHDKLARQVDFMRENDCTFSFTGYEFADASGRPNGKVVSVPARISYKQALKNTTIWTSTVMFDMEKLDVDDVLMPDVRRGQDTATWWKVLKKIDYAYGLNEVLSFYRRSAGSLSSNKLTALKRTWNLYRNVEGLGFCKSCECFIVYCFNAVRRRV
ncbi:glycosyltransferase family 2 protein [Candidatus Saccharibacteria bacterium]|nr:glycosyltransferase family 2 protein [Candidatus Saccharibacteria bacterium]